MDEVVYAQEEITARQCFFVYIGASPFREPNLPGSPNPHSSKREATYAAPLLLPDVLLSMQASHSGATPFDKPTYNPHARSG